MSQSTMSSEGNALLESLTGQRRHVLGILEGLSEEDLRRPVLPSGGTCLCLVHHLALDVERFWFRAVMAGGPDGDRQSHRGAPEGGPRPAAPSSVRPFLHGIARCCATYLF